MPTLTDDVKVFIVQQLACFEPPGRVTEAVKEEFGIEMPRQQVQCYDPGKHAGAGLSAKLRAIFDETRTAYLSDLSETPAAHKAARVKRLEAMTVRAMAAGDLALAAQLLAQAAKEMGDAFSNRSRVRVETVADQFDGMSDEEHIAEVDAIHARVKNMHVAPR